MSDELRDAGADKLRQRIAEEAARMVAKGSDSTRSRFRAARRVARGWVRTSPVIVSTGSRSSCGCSRT